MVTIQPTTVIRCTTVVIAVEQSADVAIVGLVMLAIVVKKIGLRTNNETNITLPRS